MNQQTFNRGEEITENWEISPEGRFRLFYDHSAPDAISQQQVKTGVKQMVFDFDDDFFLSGINTVYRRVQLDNAGRILRGPAYEQLMPHSMNENDLKGFVANFAPPIRPSITNGLVRGPLGYNRVPIYGPTGQVINYTPEELAKAATRDYHLYNADGTRIKPLPDAPANEDTLSPQ